MKNTGSPIIDITKQDDHYKSFSHDENQENTPGYHSKLLRKTSFNETFRKSSGFQISDQAQGVVSKLDLFASTVEETQVKNERYIIILIFIYKLIFLQ